MEVPERAVWTRTLLAELNRVLNHLMFLGSYPLELGAITPIFYAFRERETHPGGDGGGLRRPDALHVQPGRRPQGGPARRLAGPGRASAVADGAPAAARHRGPDPRQRDLPGPHPRRRRAVTASTITRTASAARSPAPPASTSTCAATSPTSPTASCRTCSRSSPATTATATPASRCCSTRCKVSLDLADACLDRLRSLPPGPVNVRLPKVLKVPEGHTYAWTENPLGINGYYLVSRGEKTPWRLKLRSRLVQQHPGAARAAARAPGRRHGRDPRLDVLRGRRHRQVRHGRTA